MECNSYILNISCPFTSFIVVPSQAFLQGVGHYWWRWTRNSQTNLNTIVNKPLQGGKSTNHDNPGSETCPHSFETKSLGGIANGRALGFVHVGDDSVGRVRHNGAKHSSNVTSGKGY